MSRIEAVTFDFWNTLLRADVAANRARRKEAWIGVLDSRSIPVEGTVLDAVFDRVSELFNQGWTANEQFTMDHAAAAAFELLGDVVDEPCRVELLDAWATANLEAGVEVTEGLTDALDELSRAGVGIGIICDVGLTPSAVLRGYLDSVDLLRRFDHWSFSDDVGAYKPDPSIFGHALAGLEVDRPSRAVHVGDLRRTDVAGAIGVGMVSVRYRGVEDDPAVDGSPEGDHVIDHHLELLDIVLGG